MRILYIHQYFCTPRGSSGTRSYAQAKAMMAAGHEVVMLTSSAQLRDDEVPAGKGIARRGDVAGVDCIVLDIPYHQTMGFAGRILAFLKFMAWCCRIVLSEPRIDCVYATSTPLTVGAPALLAKLVREIPYVFEVRDLWPDVPLEMGILKPGLIARGLKFAERAIYRHARLLVPVNDDVGRRMRETLGRQKTAVVAPNACDCDLFRPDRDGEWFRREQGLEGKTLCVHTGTMGRVNGLDIVLDAAKAMAEADDVRFVLIGDGREKARLAQRVTDETIDNVLILDAMPKEQLADVLATADVGLMTVDPLPVLQMNCANKFADYLASGLPIALNYRGWQAELLARWGAGSSADLGDTPGFVAVIRTLIGDEDLRRRMSAAGRQVAQTDMNRQVVADRLLDAMEPIAEQVG